MLGDRIKYLRNITGLTQEELCEHIGIAQSTLAMLESNKRKSASKKTLLKLSDFFQVSINYFLIEEFWNIYEREEIKNTARDIIKGDNPINKKVDAAINLYKSYYYRSLEESNFNNKHAKLKDFIAMMLNQESSKDYLPSDVYNKLVEKYGLKEGMLNNDSYFNCNNIININAPCASKYSKEEESYIQDLRKLNDLGKSKVIAYTKDLLEMPKYKNEDKVTELPKKENNQWESQGKEYLMPIACHDDNLTDEEKENMDNIINNFLKNKK